MLVQESIPEAFLVQRGLTNYWGYNTIGHFAPHQGYSAAVRSGQPGGQVAEFKAMVDALHAAGIEVLLDVVFDHTAESDHLGPTFCHRGLDNLAYYRLDPDDPRRYLDTTGCGNSLNAGDPQTLQLIMDSLRYWLTEMHVDGYRFDLAPALARQEGEFGPAAFFDLIAQDPVVSRAKLIAEPWDGGPMDSYDLGQFPPAWRELNGRYRDTMRDFWRSHPVSLGEFASRFCGSADMYGRARRRPTASVNLITAMTGSPCATSSPTTTSTTRPMGNPTATARRQPLVELRRGGPDRRPGRAGLRARQSRAMLTTLLLSFGIPMLLGGDEIGRTQQGNNNAYCQDNQTSWFDWSVPDTGLLEFTKRLIALRRTHPVFRRGRFLAGTEASELRWFTPVGTEMTVANWADRGPLAIALYLDGRDDPDQASDGTWLADDDFLILVNAQWSRSISSCPYQAPGRMAGRNRHVDLSPPAVPATGQRKAGDHVTVGPRSAVVLSAQPRAPA